MRDLGVIMCVKCEISLKKSIKIMNKDLCYRKVAHARVCVWGGCNCMIITHFYQFPTIKDKIFKKNN